MRRSRSGFTLVDLLIAIAIVGILVAVVAPAACEYIKKNGRAEEAAAPPPVPSIPIATAANWEDDLKDELKVVCIDGFEYYFASIAAGGLLDDANSDKSRAVLAPKFDKETALPKRCSAEQEKKP